MAWSLTNTITNSNPSNSTTAVTYVPNTRSGSASGGVSTVAVFTSGLALKYSSFAVTGFLRITGITVTTTSVTVKGYAGLYIPQTWGPSTKATVQITGTGQTSISETKNPYASGATYQQYGNSFSWTWNKINSSATKTIQAKVSFESNSWFHDHTCTISYKITIPALPTYTISYNGNGATSGSTSNQTKIYGTALSLRSNGFTKTNYTFVKWNTKADGSGTSYAAGASYTTNAGATLYAQWKSDYTKPTITNLKAYRVNSTSSTAQDPDGTYIYITFSYTYGKNGSDYVSPNTKSLSCNPSLTISPTFNPTASSGTYSGYASAANINNSYTITVSIVDSSGSASTSIKVGPATYPITINGNTNVTFGIPVIVENHSSAIGTIVSNVKNTEITTAGIDTPTAGASITLTPGKYVVYGEWIFNTGSSSGARNLQVAIYNGSTILARQRIFASAYNWATLQTIWIGELTASSTTLTVKGSSSMTYSGEQNNRIVAIRIA